MNVLIDPVNQRHSQARILLVDDDPMSLMVMNKALEEAYQDLRFATSGAQALELLETAPADLILLDMSMPDMDGLEVCRRLKLDSAMADIPVIFVTAHHETLDETNALEAGGVDFITKPINAAVVRARVKTHLTLKAQADLLKQLAFIDGLTGIANRRRYDEALVAEWRNCRRNGQPLSVLMIDIDHFKQFNDYYGHLEGDLCLKTIAATIKQVFVRPHDLVARFGGEEFVCLLPACNKPAAIAKADELQLKIANLAIRHLTSSVAPVVTLSIGVATALPNSNREAEDIVKTADSALYQAKIAGRNRVCAAPNDFVQIAPR